MVYYVVRCLVVFFFCKQKTAYEMRISDWSSDVCSSDLIDHAGTGFHREVIAQHLGIEPGIEVGARQHEGAARFRHLGAVHGEVRSEERRVGKVCVSRCSSRWSLYH